MLFGSSPMNDSVLHPYAPSIIDPLTICLNSETSFIIFPVFFITNTLILFPLCTLVVYRGLQQWQQQRVTSRTMSHSDSFTYHMVIMEWISVCGSILACGGIFSGCSEILMAGYCLWSFTWYGETLLHILTCFERYLAVVHPINYLSLRGNRGIKIRNICNGCAWVLSVAGMCLMYLQSVSFVVDICLLSLFLIIISFCSLYVFLVLIRRRPGEGEKVKLDKSKQGALYTIVIILVVLLLRVIWNLIFLVQGEISGNRCLPWLQSVWINIPSAVVLPLLFLHRAGMLACCTNRK